LINLMDALNITSGIMGADEWGGRAVCVAAALWPEGVRRSRA
jgi:hypothetical protein